MNAEIIVLCIGSNKIIGDSLGPRTAEKLSLVTKDCIVYGNMKRSVNGANLSEYVKMLKTKHPNSVVIAVDACLSTKKEDVGIVKLLPYGVTAGKAVKKDAAPIGTFSVVGIVAEYGEDVYGILRSVPDKLIEELTEKAAILTSLAVKKIKHGSQISEIIV